MAGLAAPEEAPSGADGPAVVERASADSGAPAAQAAVASHPLAASGMQAEETQASVAHVVLEVHHVAVGLHQRRVVVVVVKVMPCTAAIDVVVVDDDVAVVVVVVAVAAVVWHVCG